MHFWRDNLNITLPDGTKIQIPNGATVKDVAEKIGPGLAKAAVAGRYTINGHNETIDLNSPLPGACSLRILTRSDDDRDSLDVLRHSTAHVMAEAICKIYPQAKLVYGPPVEDGFYYDIDLDESITPDAFEDIESEMGRIIKENRPFCRYEMPRSDALKKLSDEGNRYKIDNANRAEGETLSFYVTGDAPGKYFEDLCRGPHVPSTGVIGAFKIQRISAAYYRGDASERSLQRVYGTAFYKKKSLTAYLERLEQARRRDHRVLGKQLHLFTTSASVGSGMILWMPNGAIIRSLLEGFLKEEMVKLGYEPVYTPNIGKIELFKTSGHYPYYKDSMFPRMYEVREEAKPLLDALTRQHDGGPPLEAAREKELLHRAGIDPEHPHYPWGAPPEIRRAVARQLSLTGEGYALKPMNCPFHIQIYKARPHSYRDLPVRLAEFGTVYRYEQSGEVAGMIRVRGFTQDDAHIFCTPDQLEQEVRTTVELTRLVLDTLRFTDYAVRIGLPDSDKNKYVGDETLWEKAIASIRRVVTGLELEHTEEIGEAAFYGPKIDFIVKDCIGRRWQLGTVQVDYTLPERFDLSYVGSDNHDHRPVMIHRAPFGSMERFVGILIEHFGGAFPLWLAPVQVAVLTISEKSSAYGRKVSDRLGCAGLRVELDDSAEKIGPKKHRMRARKIPYLVVVGEREASCETVNVSDVDGRMLGGFELDTFVEGCLQEIKTKGLDRTWRAGVPANA